eukprot:TRINITY_DN5140_c0_g1_i1.p1 TRINITY_DN5140_c0_g1~~TRINITY_DN5140_c0_g1_i1.p1  ORF type:complete len:336 (+),score=64.62 TRINITY_DN5140_c0_g1_i1:40-1047(+)
MAALSRRGAAMKSMAKRRGGMALAVSLCAVAILSAGQASSSFVNLASGPLASRGDSSGKAAASQAQPYHGAPVPASEGSIPQLLASGAAAAFVVAAASILASAKATSSRRTAPKVVAFAYAPTAPAPVHHTVPLAAAPVPAAAPAAVVADLIDVTSPVVASPAALLTVSMPVAVSPAVEPATFVAGVAAPASRAARTPLAADRSAPWNSRRLRRTARAAAAQATGASQSQGIGSSRQERRHFGAKLTQRAAYAEVQQLAFDPSTLRREIQRGLLNARTSRTMGKAREASTKAVSSCGSCTGDLQEELRFLCSTVRLLRKTATSRAKSADTCSLWQ